jgi:glutamyl-tRNA reductase
MDRVAVIGLSWQQQRPDLLARFTIAREDRAARLPGLAAELGTRQLVYLATCNRVEVAFTTDAGVPLPLSRRRLFAALAGHEGRPGEAEHALRAWHGEGAAEHLFLVMCGLESARVGESEIAGQVREALELSRSLALVGPDLEAVFAEALKVARRVRPLTEGRIGKVSLADVALRRVFERLEGTSGPVAVIGIGAMSEQCARALAGRGVPVIIVNRTPERAAALAAELGCTSRALEAFRAAPDGVEALVVATGSREPVLARSHLERLVGRTPSGAAPLIVDFAVPANVTPEDAAAVGVPRIGMDEITAEAASDRERLLLEFADARALVDEGLNELRRLNAERLVGPRIAELRLRYRRTAMEGVERLLGRDLKGLGEPEREVIRRWAETLAGRFAHLPSVGLRQVAIQAGQSAVEAFFAGPATGAGTAERAETPTADVAPGADA